MRRGLLDVNVLVALLDASHVHHVQARTWLIEHSEAGWASCPLTQNGCARIMSLPAYPSRMPTSAVLSRLALATQDPCHEFWSDDISLLSGGHVDTSRIHGPRQVTDLYLLALAVHNGGRFVTFDSKLPLAAVKRAKPEHLVIL